MDREETCNVCQTALTLSNTRGGRHEVGNCAQVLYSQRNRLTDDLADAVALLRESFKSERAEAWLAKYDAERAARSGRT